MKFSRVVLSALLLGLGGQLVAAPAAPTPADIANPTVQQKQLLKDQNFYQQRQAPEKSTQQEDVLKGAKPEAKELPLNSAKFRLREVHFNASHFIDAATLNQLAAGYIGKDVSFADINALVAKINAIYAERGIITALAIVPPQDIAQGVLNIRLVEGRLGKLQVTGNKRVAERFYQQRIHLDKGDVIDVPALKNDLQLLNHSGVAKVQASMKAGAGAGESDVILKVDEPPTTQLQLFADNNGSDSTGKYRAGVVAQVYSPLGRDDQLTLQAVGSDKGGEFNGALAYEVPVNQRGGRVSLAYTQGEIDIINGPFQDLDITGDSKLGQLGYQQPFYHRDRLWLDGFINGSYTSSETQISDVTLSDVHVWRSDAGVTASGSGVGYSWGVRQALTYASVDNTFDERTVFWLLNGSGVLNFVMPGGWIGVMRGGWQLAQESALPSVLLFQAGGVSSVRGYQQSAISGAHGLFSSFEAQYRVGDFTPYVFRDQAVVGGTNSDHVAISSVGAGLRWQYRQQLILDVAWGVAQDQVAPHQHAGELHARIEWHWPGS